MPDHVTRVREACLADVTHPVTFLVSERLPSQHSEQPRLVKQVFRLFISNSVTIQMKAI